MSASSPRGRAAAAATGFLVGAAAGFLLTEIVAVFFSYVLDRAVELGGTGGARAAHITALVLCALIGAAVGARRAGRGTPHRNRGR